MKILLLLLNFSISFLFTVATVTNLAYSQENLQEKNENTSQKNDFESQNELKSDNASDSTAEKPPIVKDTFAFRYHFEKGDTLIYSVLSRDSISINFGAPLLRIRFEKIMLTCDSVTPSGNYCLTQKMIHFDAKESFEDEKNVSRKNTTWLNVPIHFEIDSLGRRKKAYNPDSLSATMSPGGPFQPYLLMTFADDTTTDNRKAEQESWLVSKTEDIPENGMPLPLLRYTTLYRMIGSADTLDFKSLQKMTFIITAQGMVEVLADDLKVKTTSIIASEGVYFFDMKQKIPAVYTHNMQQKLTIHYPDGKTQPGVHNVYSTYVLDKIIRKP